VAKKKEADDLADELLKNIDEDRERLSKFFDLLLSVDADTHMIAEQVAKLAEALTRQNSLRIEAIKAKLKSRGDDSAMDDEETFDGIGSPFAREEEEEEGSN
jgi:hypothetical protein